MSPATAILTLTFWMIAAVLAFVLTQRIKRDQSSDN